MQDKFTEEEFQNLRIQLQRVNSHLPEDMAGLIWSSYTKIIGRYEAQPCTCGSSASLWANAVSVVRDYIKSVEANG